MTLTEQQVLQDLSKVTTIPSGFFKCTLNRSRGAMTALQFWCEDDSDEYTVLVSAKDEYIEMKSGYHTWPAQIVKAILTAPEGVQVAAATTTSTVVSAAGITSVMPRQPSPVLDMSGMLDFLVAYIQLNPGCITSTFDVSAQPNIVESSTHKPSTWVLEMVDHECGTTGEIEFSFQAEHATDQNIADSTHAALKVDIVTGSITSVTFS